jgi:DNA-binding response OmpR family regulator
MARILVAEDDPMIFKLLDFRLRHMGHEIFWAQDGGQAVELAQSRQPELILLDVMMPVLDGFQVLEQLMVDKATQDIPVIMLTARGQENDIVKGIQAGARDYIVKPFSFPELIARMNVALARRAAN